MIYNDAELTVIVTRRLNIQLSEINNSWADPHCKKANILSSIDAEWTTTFYMAGSITNFSSGSKVTSSTKVLPIGFGEKFSVPNDGTDPVVGPDPGAPVGGFLFHTDKKLSAIVYQDSTSSPIYISPTPDPPHSGEELVPKESVALFFSKKLETKTMFSTATVDPFYLNYTGKTAHVVTYTKDGNWTVIQADRSGECDVEVPPHRETNGDGLPNGPAKRYRKKVVEITEEYD
ncbi:hypothetical protein Dda_6926 [Drechslerella dactyloides]|uniref:Uncharacterized protein n=1 Tax=Drechslerella dactyloides TaxID=74499 RepID=A0AAD6ISU9_DREDA|nr:hypothetical protein Dda_6926 [Drechslerella dactyloides]